MDILGQGAHRRGDDKQQQREDQRPAAADAVAERAKKQLAEAQPKQRGGQRELGLRAGCVQLAGDIRQRRQVEVGTERANAREQPENNNPGERNTRHSGSL